MEKYEVPELWGRVFAVGVRDPEAGHSRCDENRKRGTTYNAYLVLGKEKNALIGCVPAALSEELMAKVDQLTNLEDLAYVVIQSRKPEHSGALPDLLNTATRAVVMTSIGGKEELITKHHLPTNQVHAVKAGNKLDLGDRHLEFIELYGDEELLLFAPDNGMFFSGEYFSTHVAQGICDEDLEDVLDIAKLNFDNLLTNKPRGLEEVIAVAQGFKIKVISPAHGVVFKNPKRILEAYGKWLEK
jgi:flavorubredoxin